MSNEIEIPLFPLHTVLFPGGPLPLRIFEPRYLDLVSRCLRQDSGFGVLLIREGGETGAAKTHEIGTLARIIDWYQGSDGLLGLTVLGEQRFVLRSTSRQADGLNVGRIQLLAADAELDLPARYEILAHILESVLEDLGTFYAGADKRYGDAAWVSYRLAEILPMSLDQKQRCLELDSPLQRLELIRPLLEALRA